MKQFNATERQLELLKLNYDTVKLELLQKKTISRIQVVSFKGLKTLKSVEDNCRKIRIVLVSLLVKIFMAYSETNEERLLTLKRIIYQAKLQAITQQQGIIRQHLLKSVAQQFTKLKIGGNVQTQIIKMFNCCPFFDEIVLSAFKERNPLIIENDCELASWLDRQMSLRLFLNEQPLINQKFDELFLIGLGQQFHASKDCKSQNCNYKGFKQYLRFSTQILSQNQLNKLDNIQNRKTRDQIFNQQMFQDEPQTPDIKVKQALLFQSVLSSSSPEGTAQNNLQAPNGQSTKQNKKFLNSTCLFDSVNSNTAYNKLGSSQNIEGQLSMINQKQDKKLIKVRRTNRNDEGSYIWNLLCCRTSN